MLDKLRKLINGELVAAIQYKILAEALTGGENFDYVKKHCEEHYEEEMGHYSQLVSALMQRGGTPDCDLKVIHEDALPPTSELSEYSSDAASRFFIDAENSAIQEYTDYHDLIKDSDPDLDDLIVGILAEEKEHKLDFVRLHESSASLTLYRNRQREKFLIEKMLKRR